MVPAYVNIAHFRAPYKNAYFSGYGQEPPPPPPPGPPGDLVPGVEGVLEKRDGVYYWKSSPRAEAIAELKNSRAVFIGGQQELVELVPYTQAEFIAAVESVEAAAHLESLSAYNWMKTKLKENKVVIAPVWLLATGGPTVSLVAIPTKDKANIKQAAGTPVYGVLAEPSIIDRVPGGIVGVAIAGAVVVGGIGLLAMKKKKRGGTPSYRMS